MRAVYWIAAVLVVVTGAWAQPDGETPDFLLLDSAFAAGEYERVELLGLRLLQGNSRLSPDEAARIDLTIGYALIMMSREREAREYFVRALDADSTLTLDPVQVSPKFRMVFDEVKAEHAKARLKVESHAGSLTSASPIQSPSLHVSPRSLISNLILPGTGHWREGYNRRGTIYFGLQAVCAGVLVWRIQETRESREDYLSATDPSEIPERYDDYNSDYRIAWGTGIATAAMYLAAQIDLIQLGAKQSSPSGSQVNVLPYMSVRRMGVSVLW